MTLNDYLMEAWNMMANSGPVARVAEKSYKGPNFQQKPIVVHEKQKGQPYGGFYQNGLIKMVDGLPQQKQTLNHEMAHDKYVGMYNSLAPLDDVQNWQPLIGISKFDQKVKQYDPSAYTQINQRLQNPLYKKYVDIPNEFYAYYSNMPQAPELRKYY